MRDFREVTSECVLQDLGRSGVAYTWDNHQPRDANVKARIDRAFANDEFRQRYDHTRVRHVCAAESDHCFVIVEFRNHAFSQRPIGAKQFRYENVWESHQDYEPLIAQTWREQTRNPGLQGIMDSLGALQHQLEPWGAREFGILTRTVRNLQKRLDKLRQHSVGRGPSNEEISIMKKLIEALRLKEV